MQKFKSRVPENAAERAEAEATLRRGTLGKSETQNRWAWDSSPFGGEEEGEEDTSNWKL